MKFFRIVELIHNSSSKDRKREFVIQKKRFFGWKEVMLVELDHKRISFSNYDEAELYLLNNYTGHGLCTKIGSYYIYEAYNYSF